MSRQTHSRRRAAHHRRVRLEREAAREAKLEAAKERAEYGKTESPQTVVKSENDQVKTVSRVNKESARGSGPGGAPSWRIQQSNKAKGFIRSQTAGTLKYPNDILTSTTDYMMIDVCEFQPAMAAGIGTGEGGAGAKLGSMIFYMPSNIATDYNQGWSSKPLSPNARMIMKATDMAMSGQDATAVSGYLNSALGGTELTVAANMFAKGVNSMTQANLSANDAIGLQQGMGINSVPELTWSGHGGQRRAVFNILMQPKDSDEADTVQKIINTFKVAMHPSKNSANMSGGSSTGGRFVQYPLSFKIKYMSGSGENQYLNKWKPMVLESFTVNYTPDNVYTTHPDGSPVAASITTSFKELKIIYADDIIDTVGKGGAGY